VGFVVDKVELGWVFSEYFSFPPPAAGEQQSSAGCLLHAVFLFGLFFDPEDGDDMFL
jgi:hypothetical protein